MFASGIQYEMPNIHSGHPSFHFIKCLPQYLPLPAWALSYIFTLRGTSQFIVCEQFIAWHSSTNSCQSNTLPLYRCPPCTLLLPILSCRWAQFCHALSCPGTLAKPLCWHSNWWMLFFSGLLFFTSNWFIFCTCLLQFRTLHHFNHLSLSSVLAVDRTEVS